jgi:pyruvate/2-oxoglutarate dehydrogenase complex dihydrolipoamide dehydrogenase (E3) component
MRLLKREVGVIALEVMMGRNAAASALETLPSAGMRGYTPPEVARVGLRKAQSTVSKAQTRSLLSAVRGGGGL